MSKPQDLDELCGILDQYLKKLYQWQMRVNNRASKLEDKALGGHQDDDPPPPPPALG
jgi:hypothetical protein